MYENKILVNIYILSLSRNYEMFIPVNEKVGHIANLLNNVMSDCFDSNKVILILNVDNGKCYKNNELVRDTDIVNGTKLVLI
ncbi:MAG: hypothetical protein IJB21_05165 [Bacilli bacterium]|nr:hypothetical protein [Bacilli bacterium]